MWAEDGALFLAEATTEPWHLTLLDPYAGYLHTVPRLLADVVVTLVPAPHWAIAVTAASCVSLGAVAAGVHLLTRELVGLTARTVLALATACAPLLPLEVVGNLANLHWLVLWLMPWLLLADGGGRARRWALGLLTLLVVTTEVQALAFAPLLLWRPRGRGVLPRLLAVSVGAALQVHAMTSTPRPVSATPPGTGETVLAWLHVVVLPWVLGPERALVGGGGDGAPGRGAPATAVVVGSALVALRYGTRVQGLVAAGAPVAGLVLWVVAVRLNGPELRAPDGPYAGLRYGYVPALMLAVPVVVALTLVPLRRARPAVVLAVGALAMLGLALGYSPTSARSLGPAWREQVRAATSTCETEAAPAVAQVPISPAGWYAPVPCRRLG